MLKTKYITPEEFKEYTGIDLGGLRDDANPSNKEMSWLVRLEDRMSLFIDSNFFVKIDDKFSHFSDYQKECYKKALYEQGIYIWRNGDISTDSGYDADKGEIINISKLKKLQIAPNAYNYLLMCGLLTRRIKTRNSGNIWLFYW